MKITQKICIVCNKDVTGQTVVGGFCPICDEPLKIRFSDYETEPFANMDAYYSSCATPKGTVGGLADRNTKLLGSNYIAEQLELKKAKREEGLKRLEQKTGKKTVKKSGNRPFYRPHSDKPITDSEAAKIIKEDGFTLPTMAERPGRSIKVKKRGINRVKV